MLRIFKKLYGWFEEFVVLVLQSEMQEPCHLCGKFFKPSLDTPLPTRKWPYHFCCDLHKQDYIRSRE